MAEIHTISESTDSNPVRAVPHNIEAEQGLLAAVLYDNMAMERVSDFLRAEHFYHPAHQRIYTAIQTLIDRASKADAVTLKTYFEKDSDLEPVGGAQYLFDLQDNVVTTFNAPHYAQVIYDLFLRRELIRLGQDVCNESETQELEDTPEKVMERAESRLFKLAEDGQTGQGFTTLKDSVSEALTTIEKAYKSDGHISGLTTGLADLDEQLGGLHPSDLLILAGRPSMGKTALATTMAFRAARRYAETGGEQGGRVGFFSLEMSAEQLAGRVLSDVARVTGDDMRKGKLNQDSFSDIIKASQLLQQVPLYIDDMPGLSISAVRTRARRLKRQHGLDLIVVDYLQLLSGTGSKQSSENRVNEISEITRGLKGIAKELQVPVLALSQLSRAVESREDKRPMLSDLRESGSIEQDADVVMFVYREEYYLSREEPQQRANETSEKYFERHENWSKRLQETASIAEAIVAKQRHGPIGNVRMFFDGRYTRFDDLDQRH